MSYLNSPRNLAVPFDPNQPQAGELIDAVQLRNQFNGLKGLIDAIPAGPQGPAGAEGPPGEVTTAALDAAILGTARNPTGVSLLSITVSDLPTQAEVQAVVDKLNEFISAARREP